MIIRDEYHGYEPEAHTNLNTSGEIRIHATNMDIIVNLAWSYLLTEGIFKKADAVAYVNGDKVTLVNNGIMFLFNSVKRQLSKTTE